MADGTKGSLRTNSTRDVISYMLTAFKDVVAASWFSGITGPVIGTDQEKEQFRAIGAAPALRLLKGGLQPVQPRSEALDVVIDMFEASIGIPKDWWRREKTGQIQMMIDQLANSREVEHWAKFVSELIAVGDAATSLCFDGKPFYSTTHESGDSGVQSNLDTIDVVSPAAVTRDEMSEAILDMATNFLVLKDDAGEPINASAGEFLVHVPIALSKVTTLALNQVFTNQGESNIVKASQFKFRQVTDPRLTIAGWTNRFAMHVENSITKPIVLMQETDSMDYIELGLDSEHCKKHRELVVGIEVGRGRTYGDWRKSRLGLFV